MQLFNNISLKNLNTFSLDYLAESIIEIESEAEAAALFKNPADLKKPLLILGGGSNILFTDDFSGTVIRPVIKGISVESEEKDSAVISAGAGVKWDDFVDWCVERDYCGTENLALIPGNVGATPVQNIGAYGVEVKDIIVGVRAISVIDGSERYFTNAECRFGYRSSIFKLELKGRYLVTRVFYRVTKTFLPMLGYGSLKDEVDKTGEVTLRNIRNTVVTIRKSKLPDPEVTGNAGSFFKNPVLRMGLSERLKESYPGMPVYSESPGYVKLAAGWLIDQCGWKGTRRGDAGVHDKQALVLVNYGNAEGKEIFNLSEDIRKSVKDKFGVNLEREVEVI